MAQLSPPKPRSGDEHHRAREIVPLPQEREHCVHGDHWDQPPSTVKGVDK